jgi:hypothetical protein
VADAITLLPGTTLPHIAYDSVLEDATLSSAATTATDGAADNVLGWQEYTFWKPTGGGTYTIEADLGGSYEVSCWAMHGHDALGTVAMDTWNGSAWVEHSTELADGSGDTLYLRGDTLTTTKLRFRIASLSYLAILFAGPELTPAMNVKPGGWSDPRVGALAVTEPETSRDGVWLGTTIRRWQCRQSVTLEDMAQSWVADYWRPFMTTCSAQPYFLHWHTADWPDGAAFCFDNQFSKPDFSRNAMMTVAVESTMSTGVTP